MKYFTITQHLRSLFSSSNNRGAFVFKIFLQLLCVFSFGILTLYLFIGWYVSYQAHDANKVDLWDTFPSTAYDRNFDYNFSDSNTTTTVPITVPNDSTTIISKNIDSSNQLIDSHNHPCYPQNIHLSLGSDCSDVDVDINDWNQNDQSKNKSYVAMTVSFTVDYVSCPKSKYRPFITYGPVHDVDNNTENRSPSGSTSSNVQSSFIMINNIGKEEDPLSFNYTSAYVKDYQSPWIYHITLTYIECGFHNYYYEISIYENNTSSSSLDEDEEQEQEIQQQSDIKQRIIVEQTKPIIFTTPPLPNHSVNQKTTIAFVGDVGQSDFSGIVMTHIWKRIVLQQEQQQQKESQGSTTGTNGDEEEEEKDNNNFAPITNLVIPGDMSYANANPHFWETWFNFSEPLLRSVPVTVAFGNHEIESDSSTWEFGIPYENYFRAPNRIQDAIKPHIPIEYRKQHPGVTFESHSTFRGQYDYGNSFFTYQHGCVQMIFLNSYTFSDITSNQYNWLLSTLQSVERNVTPWVVVVFHVPLYTTFSEHKGESDDMKETIEQLLVEYNVNLVINGHDHAYQRTYPVSYNVIDPTGKSPVYITVGTGGAPSGLADEYSNRFWSEEWIMKRNLHCHGYVLFHTVNTTYAYVEYVTDTAQQMFGGFQDSFWLKNHVIVA